jgi:hypothetical protein
VTQHAGLDAERWASFSLDQQVLMIGNEMNRATRMVERDDVEALRRGYARVLRLADLTAQAAARPTFLRELLRWRDLVAELYVRKHVDPAAHRATFRALLQLRPLAARQIQHLAGAR